MYDIIVHDQLVFVDSPEEGEAKKTKNSSGYLPPRRSRHQFCQ